VTKAAPWTVYILRCADGTLYTGATSDAGRRVAEHEAGDGAAYTRSRRPVRVVYEERVRDRSAALRREAALKRLTRTEKLALIERSKRPPGPGERPARLARRKLTVRPVYRAIVKKNERQATGLFDVLVCGHAVPATVENTYRKASACPECRLRVQEYVDRQQGHEAAPANRRAG
jgi:putative endonuclease